MSAGRLFDDHANAVAYVQRTLSRRIPPSETFELPDPLPPPPVLPPMENSVAFCTDLDFSQTIIPLYASGWGVVYINYYQRLVYELKPLKIPTLTGFFKFTSFDDAISFMRDVIITLGSNVGVRLFPFEHLHLKFLTDC
jgi:hypothetical protein